MNVLELKKLTYSYDNGKNIFKNLDFNFEKGKFYAIIGHYGTGKTTLLSLMAGLDEPNEGEILFEGTNIKAKGYEHHRKHNVSIVFQNYNLIDYLTAYENIKIVNKNADKDLLKKLGLKEDEINRNVLKLSGGQQQRVAFARALASDSSIILADEPTGNLDSNTANEITEILKSSAHNYGKCVIVVTHSKELANSADVVLNLKDGKFRNT